MHPHREKIIEQIENRLQFVITINIFMLSVMYSLSKMINMSEDHAQASILKGSLFIVFYIIAYVIFENWGKKKTGRGLRWINNSTLIGIASFILPALYTALISQNGITAAPWEVLLINLSTVASTILSIVTPWFIILLVMFWEKEPSTL